MSITVHFGVGPDLSIGQPVLYELAKKSGGEHKETLRSIDSKRRNEKVIQACTQHLLDNSHAPTHFVAKQWKENDAFRLALEDAGGHDVGPDDAQNYVRQDHLQRMKKSKPKRDSVARSGTSNVSAAASRLVDPEVAAGIRAYQVALPQIAKAKPTAGDIMARRATIGMSLQYFVSLLPAPHTDPTTGAPGPGSPIVRDLFTISSHDGIYIPLRWHTPVHQPPGRTPGAVMLYIHGGAMIASSATQYVPIVSNLVAHTAMPAMAVEYRFAPEYTSISGTPGAIEDCYDALNYLREHASDLGVDLNRIAIVGDGGGGGIAAGLCQYTAQRGGLAASKQLLFSPMLDDRPKSAQPKIPASMMMWNHADEECAWQAVLGGRRGIEASRVPNGIPNGISNTHNMADMPLGDGHAPPEPPDAILAPGRATEISRAMPSLYIDVGEHDIVRDDCISYASKFWASGVNAEMHVWPGVGCWFDLVAPRAQVSERALDARVRALLSV